MKARALLLIILVSLSIEGLTQIGVIDSKEIIRQFAGLRRADSLATIEKRRLQTSVDAMESQLLTKKGLVDSMARLVLKDTTAKLQYELVQSEYGILEQQLASAFRKANEDYTAFVQTVLDPWREKVSTAIGAVARQRKIQVVMDLQQVIYMDRLVDITKEVLEKLK